MKKNIKKIILITLAVIPGIILSFCLAVIILLYLMLESSSQYTMNVFEINNDKYTLKIIEENYLRGIGVGSDLFSYENVNVNEKKYIGCGTLILVGYDDKKEYLYGKTEFDEKKLIGIYRDNDKLVEGDALYENYKTKEESDYGFNLLKKQCTGYFVLNLKTGEYQGNLYEEQQKKILLDKEIKNPMLSPQKFLKINGKEIKNYEMHDTWMRGKLL